jgi:hypothetical protein
MSSPSPLSSVRARIDPTARVAKAQAATYRLPRQQDLLGASPDRQVEFFGVGGAGENLGRLSPGQVDLRA